MKPLTAREKKFVEAYLRNERNGAQAAIAAGYSKASAKVTASRMLTRANVRAAVNKRVEKQAAKVEEQTDITLMRLVEELAHSALLDPKDFYGPDGRVLPVPEMPEHARRALAGVEVSDTYNEGGGDAADILMRVRTNKIKHNDKKSSIELIAKLLGMLREKKDIELSGEIIYRWRRDDE